MVEIRVTGGGPGARGLGGSVPAHGVRCARYILWIRAILGGKPGLPIGSMAHRPALVK